MPAAQGQYSWVLGPVRPATVVPERRQCGVDRDDQHDPYDVRAALRCATCASRAVLSHDLTMSAYRVTALMPSARLAGAQHGKRRGLTRQDKVVPSAPDLIGRDIPCRLGIPCPW